MSKNKFGHFYGVGLGPGDPDLLTVKAQRLLRKCPVLCVPKGNEETEGLALSFLKKLKTVKNQEVISMPFPMTLDAGRLDTAWNQAAAVIAGKLKEGKEVAFLTEGDPLLYSTFIYVYESLRKVFPEAEVEIVPGVSSVTAAAARALTPLVAGNEKLAILPSSDDEQALRKALGDFDTVVFLKVNRSFDKLLDILEEKGLASQAVLVTRCFLPGEKVFKNIGELRGKKLDYFSLLIVRKR